MVWYGMVWCVSRLLGAPTDLLPKARANLESPPFALKLPPSGIASTVGLAMGFLRLGAFARALSMGGLHMTPV
jgi:hypothetical protein